MFMALRLGVDFEAISPLAHVSRISPRPVLILAAGEPRRIWREPTFGHCEVFHGNPERFEVEVVGFFDECLSA